MDQTQKLTKKEKKELKKLEYQEQLQKEQQKKLFKQIGIFVGVFAVIVFSVFGLIKLANSEPQETLGATNENLPKVSASDIIYGDKSAPLTLIEYSDFQCPACAYYHPIVKQVLKDFDGKILFVYRFFPLSSHKNAIPSSQAAYAAYLQGKFWEMHDVIFENQKSWADSNEADKIFFSYAQKLELDMSKYKSDVNADSTKKFIEDESNTGITIGVNSTPTFFLNNKQIKPKGYEEFKTLIQDELK